jgi:uncharacterized secreted protein with C-terminal beta-propeller domain
METSSRSTARWLGLAASVVVLGACTGNSAGPFQPLAQAATRLVSYDSCEDALAQLKEAVGEHVTAYGLGGPEIAVDAGTTGGDDRLSSVPEAAAAPDQESGYSTTNTHEVGVDEPDLVKTDGRRIVTAVDGALRVIDAESKLVTGELKLSDDQGQWWADQLLLSGDRALLLGHGAIPFAEPAPLLGPDIARSTFLPSGSRLVLVDLSEEPTVVSELELDGTYVDARQVGSVARLVVRSGIGSRLTWAYPDGGRTEAEALATNREILAESTIEDWLPRYALSGAGDPNDGPLVDCDDIRHPEVYSGTAMLTVLSVDLAGSLRAEGSVGVMADGQTVYGTESSLYIADDHSSFAFPTDIGPSAPLLAEPLAEPQTEVHKFDVTEPGQPRYVGSGVVDGWILNQYSLSEYDGHLRIATTEDNLSVAPVPVPGDVPASQSRVAVLTQRGDRLVEVGSVGGLGKGEQIYAVRFVGPVGYVVTFRQTDPLYTLDLSDPTRPRVVGELKIPGYSAYLHPAGDERLIGVGQDANANGQVQGSQVSLFDVTDVAAPTRLDTYTITGGWSDVEYDPHAFLYWPDTGTVVMPVWAYGDAGGSLENGEELAMAAGALVLRLDGDALIEVGVLSHVRSAGQVDWSHDPSIRRSLIIGETLWTVSGSGAMASDLDDLAEQAWVPFAG